MIKSKAFTLIELLIVIAIIGLLATVATISYTRIRQNSRDLKRVSDIKTIQTALFSYYADEHKYPLTLNFGGALVGSTSSTTYMAIIPQNPAPRTDSGCPDNEYTYMPYNNGHSYVINFCISKQIGNVVAGNNQATPTGIQYVGNNTFICGANITYGNESYSTVKIGAQCWFAKNLDIGTRVNLATPQADANSGTFQKWCYNDDPANCVTYGGYYQWHTAMGLPQACDTNTSAPGCTISSTQQGLCPTGWHIPTTNDWHTLELVYATLPCALDHSDGDCDPAGSDLMTGGISGFNALPAGGSFLTPGSAAYFWTANTYDAQNIFYRYTPLYQNSFLLDTDYGTDALSVRCVQN